MDPKELCFSAGFACGFARTALKRPWTAEDFKEGNPPQPQMPEERRASIRETVRWMRDFADAMEAAIGPPPPEN